MQERWRESQPACETGVTTGHFPDCPGVAGEDLGVPALELAKLFKNKLMDPKILSGWAPVIHQEHKGV